ncbi:MULTISPECIES: peptidyl-tRNA hydrolase [unclassified Amycolatopsis]|uniref:peptidyl-tRNA hydrolase n=1 Tax=unclassified Amycolatopsis TaxID=2618356 RepID=UPI001EE7E536|nr:MULTISPECIES: peptidyl-tRNA hydrolase [unclassified Amycolatopsis]MCG3751410.1 peptidyl-tRNA hydrolase [Amycolatopsis sp. Poz14]
MNPLLEPLRARYASWLGLPAEDTSDTSDENPDEVRAMPIILRIERAEPPGRTALLEAAAAAALAVCLDDRVQPGGEWAEPVHAWLDNRIRKVARRARGAHWQAVLDQPGITIEVDGAQARALVPGLVREAPKEVSRLQISGSELPADTPGPAPADVPLVMLNPDVPMTVGKASAQVGHATMILAALLPDDELAAWAAKDYRVAVRTPSPARWKELCPVEDPEAGWRDNRVIAVRDAGFTEVDPGTITVLAQQPGTSA